MFDGGIGLGADVNSLPLEARSTRPIRFTEFILLVDGKVDDVWIDDLKALPDGAVVDGTSLPPNASLDEIKRILGPCEPIEGVKGGVYFRCAKGLVLGTDWEGKGQFIQIRLRDRFGASVPYLKSDELSLTLTATETETTRKPSPSTTPIVRRSPSTTPIVRRRRRPPNR